MGTSPERLVRVVKVGGSLFDYAGLEVALRRFLDRQPPAATVLIAGGGRWADAIRQIDSCSQIGEQAAHDLCIEAMRFTARLLTTLAPWCRLETCWDRLLTWTRSTDRETGERVLDVAEFLADAEPRAPGQPLPHDWSATSDSIAARVARVLDAAELILLKSAPLPPGTPMHRAATDGYVDGFFPRAAGALTRVRCVNLRDPDFHETSWD